MLYDVCRCYHTWVVPLFLCWSHDVSPLRASSLSCIVCGSRCSHAFYLMVQTATSRCWTTWVFVNYLQCRSRLTNLIVQRGRGYWLTFRPSCVRNQIISIQWLSFCLQYSLSSLWIFSVTITFKLSIECSGREKSLATGFSILLCLMSDQWPVRRTQSAFSVSPTYWIAHGLHLIENTRLLVPQSGDTW